MEEISARGTTNGGADGGRSNSSMINYADEMLEVVTDAGQEPSQERKRELFKRRIEKVPLLMRNNEHNKGEYDPKVVSIGPYHHGKKELQFVENVKPTVAELFVSNSGKDMNEFYTKVLEMVGYARSCYVDGSTDAYDEEEFAKMILLDGCFTLAIISWYQRSPGWLEYNDVVTHLGRLVICSICDDIVFLLENQLPFEVLKLLVSLKFRDVEQGMKIIHLFLECIVSGKLYFEEVEISEHEKQPLHLLELCRTKMLLAPAGGGDEVKKPIPNFKFWKGRQKDKFRVKNSAMDIIYAFRSVTELKAKGIRFKPSSCCSPIAIKFTSFCFYGLLELPPFPVNRTTKIMFSNMIAYELCPDNHDNPGISAYVNFLKSLIDLPGDVKELRSRHILFNTLGSDEEVANVFKEIITFGVDDYKIYDEVKWNIQKHYNSKAKTWMAELIHSYFSSPWTAIAFAAAAAVVVLSFIQTYFAIFPRSGN